MHESDEKGNAVPRASVRARTMRGEPSRRRFLTASAAALAAACAPRGGGDGRVAPSTAAPPSRTGGKSAQEQSPLSDLESGVGGRVGVYAIATDRAIELSHRADERFAMCSTFKWALSAAVLARVDRGEISLEEAVPFGEADLLDYAPATRARAAEGKMTVGELAESIITVSDNTAANLLLGLVGGPAGLTAFMRSAGDTVTRLDRDEPTLNTNLPGDERDTTSPRAMVGLMRAVLLGSVLSVQSRERLVGWLEACQTGFERLRAGLPAGWRVGDKTGSGQRGSVNDVAILWPPGRGPVLVAAYLSDSSAPLEALSGVHAAIGRAVAEAMA